MTAVETRKRNVDVYNENTGAIESIEQHYIDTDGSNLIELLGLPYLDNTKTICNDVREIEKVLGIEAARNALYNELKGVIEGSGGAVGYHHINLLTNLMCYTGYLTPINRHGINKLDVSPLGKASFEETIERLKEAAMFNIPDNMNGVSANIMFSQVPRGGTGMIDLVLNEDAFGIEDEDLDDLFA